MVALLLNQMNVGAFKINTLEKLDISSTGKLNQSSGKNDFSNELQSAVNEKRKYDKSETSSLKKFEKKFSKVNHDVKAKTNTLNKEKITEKKNEETQLAKKVDSGKAEDKLQAKNPEEAQSTSANSENQKADSLKNEEVSAENTENTKVVAEAVGTDSSKQVESLDTSLSQINADLAKLAEQLVSLMQDLQKSGNSEIAPTKEELTKATELLDKINTGNIETKEAFKELGMLMDNIKIKGNGIGEKTVGNSDFEKLMELTGNKLKVLKNELADAKEQMNKISEKGDFRQKISKSKNEGPGINAEDSGKIEQVVRTDEKVSTDEAKSQVKPTQLEKSETKPTEGVEELVASQTKKPGLIQEEKVEKTNSDELTDKKPSEKIEALKSDSKTSNGNAEKEFMAKANNTEGTNGNLKTEKNSDGVSFQTVAQNTIKDTERPTEAGRLSRTPVIDRTEVLSQIVKKADLLVGKTQSEMIMKLEPENLGKVSLKIAMERGSMTATFQAENQQVKSLLESNTDSLKEMLQEKGINVSAINVSVNQQSGDNQNWKNQSQEQFSGNTFGKRDGIGNRGNSMIGTYGIVGMTDAMSTKNNPYTKHDGEFDYRG